MLVRNSSLTDAPHLKKWLEEPGVLRWFPMVNEREIDDAIRIWLSFMEQETALTIEVDGEVAGMAVLYLQKLDRLKHQTLFAIIMGEKFRGKGGGSHLYKALEKRAREKGVSLIHLEVYEGNPAHRLYERLGFTQYGTHPKFLKEQGKYVTKILMQKDL